MAYFLRFWQSHLALGEWIEMTKQRLQRAVITARLTLYVANELKLAASRFIFELHQLYGRFIELSARNECASGRDDKNFTND